MKESGYCKIVSYIKRTKPNALTGCIVCFFLSYKCQCKIYTLYNVLLFVYLFCVGMGYPGPGQGGLHPGS